MPDSRDDVLARIMEEEEQTAVRLAARRSRFMGLDRGVWRATILISVVLGLVSCVMWAKSGKREFSELSLFGIGVDFAGATFTYLVLLLLPFYLIAGVRSLSRRISGCRGEQ